MPWDKSNPLFRWKMRHGNVKKAKKHTSTGTVGIKMARKRRFSRLRRYSPRRRYRSFRRGKAPMSLLTTLPVVYNAVGVPLFGDGQYITGAVSKAQGGDYAGALKEYADALGIQFLGYKFSDGTTWPMSKPIMTWASIIGGSLASKALTRFGVNSQFKKIPFIGKYVKL